MELTPCDYATMRLIQTLEGKAAEKAYRGYRAIYSPHLSSGQGTIKVDSSRPEDILDFLRNYS
jgi:hypothetical protein